MAVAPPRRAARGVWPGLAEPATAAALECVRGFELIAFGVGGFGVALDYRGDGDHVRHLGGEAEEDREFHDEVLSVVVVIVSVIVMSCKVVRLWGY